MIKKLINIISGFIASICPLIIAFIFGILIYNELRNFIGLVIFIALILGAIWLSIIIFKTVQSIGIVDFMTVVHASPDIDNLEPDKDSNTKKRTPTELADLYKENKNLLKRGSLKIFGDWFGDPYNNPKEISEINYDNSKKLMTIRFSDNSRIFINSPGIILEAPTILRILSVQRVKLEFQHKGKNTKHSKEYFKIYRVSNNRIETTTNIDWDKQKINASAGQDALSIYN